RTLTAALMLCAAPAAVHAAPEVQQWSTPAGARVLFVETHEIPAVDVRMTFAAGAARDGEHPGVARLTSNLLMSGTESLNGDALAEAYEREGAEVSTGAARDMGWVEFRSLSDEAHLWPVARTVADLAANPTFPPGEVERLIGQQRTSLARKAQSPGALASRAFWRTVYGDHPYGHEPLGTEESLDAITRDDIRAFHERYYAAANANLAIVGDLSRAEAERLARTLTESLPQGEPASALPRVPDPEADETVREDFPSNQAHVLIGRPAVARGGDRWPALVVANHVLGGGGFSSRLMSEVREERGLVYGISSGFSPMSARGPFRVQLQTRGDQTGEALEVVNAQLKRFVQEGPSAAEVDDAVSNITGGFPLEVDSNSELTGYLSMIGFYELPTNYLQQYRDRIAEVDAEAARVAFAEVVGDQPLVRVIVGGNRARDAQP
ncbi:MAG: pitrilysin family protein, partial [Halofilum sp. (in: g-proteobacteria)]